MKYWIGVISSKVALDRFLKQEQPWFCLPSSADLNDLIMIYASSKASHDRSGIIGTFSVSSLDDSKNDLCSCYVGSFGSGPKLIYVGVLSVKFFENPISLKKMKKHLSLSRSNFVKKNMQATYFEISAECYQIIDSLSLDQ